jgi:NhaA family Na+:H+ antiporter
VGLEIKRELLLGQLASRQRAMLPLIAALGGMIAPAVVYLLITRDSPALIQGWAIPAATDIAFALGILSLLGKRVPVSLKVFLTALAIIDDLGAIIIIALFYSSGIKTTMLLAALGILCALFLLNRRGVVSLLPYLVLGSVLWLLVLNSGVHATIAGVLLALTIPLKVNSESQLEPPLFRLEHAIHPWVAFLIMPVFALANAGLELTNLSFSDLLLPLPLGIAAGLFLGKMFGVFLSSEVAIRSGIATRPEGSTIFQLWGVSTIAGIGFTMSLFIGGLAFLDPIYANNVRLGVMMGSLVSAVTGLTLLMLATRNRPS